MSRAERHQRIKQLFFEAVELEAEERQAFLADCAEDLRADVEAMLAADQRDHTLLDGPVVPPLAAQTPSVPKQLGRFTLVRPIGEGGMGTVYEAEQDQPRRTVALKLLRSSIGSKRMLRRFEFEGELLGRLHHPGIAQIFEAGTAETEQGTQPYFAMELVAGLPLTQHADRNDLDYNARLALMARVCDAVQHAHQNGVIHRDLKPGNILVTPSGQPKVLDFGVARSTDADIELTTFQTGVGQIIGTLQYMSPEQAAGDSEAIDTRTDVYALGVLLYELMTGELPYELGTRSLPDALRVIQEVPPVRISTTRRVYRGDLDTIVQKALEKDKDRRYATAQALADDLRRTLRNEPIEARPASHFYRVRKFAARNKGVALGIATTIVALIAGLIGTGYQAHQKDLARAEAERRQLEAERTSTDLLSLSAYLDLRELHARADALWPANATQRRPMQAWVADAEALLAGLPTYEAQLEEIRSRGRASEDELGATSYEFDQREDRWWHGQLAQLVYGLRELADPERGLLDGFAAPFGLGVRRRLARASEVERLTLTSAEAQAAWSAAREAIAASSQYDGLEIIPQRGLFPLGPDPESELWEFAHVVTGSIPMRDPESNELVLPDDCGLVFVLLPARAFMMGAQAHDPNALNYDPLSFGEEGPVHRREIGAFFISKFEMTQGQWAAFAGVNPSRHQPGASFSGPDVQEPTLLHPAELISWNDCELQLARMELRLPTEPEWEFAARAGTETPWWTGAERDQLQGAANLADQSARKLNAGWTSVDEWPELNDGYALHAPVNHYDPNPFGLHNVHGNVWEWVRDPAGSYTISLDIRENAVDDFRVHRLMRGGSYVYGARQARVSMRFNTPPDARRGNIGVRPARDLQR